MNCLRGLFLCLFIFLSFLLSAQLPSDLSNIKASQISDTQLRQFLAQAKSSGITQEEFEAELLRRGLPQEEMAELKLRIRKLEEGPGETTTTTKDPETDPSKRSVSKQGNNSQEFQ